MGISPWQTDKIYIYHLEFYQDCCKHMWMEDFFLGPFSPCLTLLSVESLQKIIEDCSVPFRHTKQIVDEPPPTRTAKFGYLWQNGFLDQVSLSHNPAPVLSIFCFTFKGISNILILTLPWLSRIPLVTNFIFCIPFIRNVQSPMPKPTYCVPSLCKLILEIFHWKSDTFFPFQVRLKSYTTENHGIGVVRCRESPKWHEGILGNWRWRTQILYQKIFHFSEGYWATGFL